MKSYGEVFGIFGKYKIVHFVYSFYFCLVIYYNGNLASPWNTNTITELHRAHTTYKPSVATKTCYLKPDKGPCRGNIPMYYFDEGIMNCSTFHWGGCQGNGNRFDTRSECLRGCLRTSRPRQHRPTWCSLTFDYGYCFGHDDRYFYDPLWKTCKKTIYSGCGGNKNNFYSLEQCEAICRFGNGKLTISTRDTKSGVKKVVIVNPLPTVKPQNCDEIHDNISHAYVVGVRK